MKRTIQSLAVSALALIGLFVGAQATQAATYTVRSGDTLAGLFPSTWQAVCAHYGINCNLIYPGQVYSDDGLGGAQSPVYEATPPQPSSTTTYTSSRSYGGPNGYGWGWCTWWVKEKRPDIGGYWGNAGYNWLSAAQQAGFTTGYTPAPGAIGVQPGHVVYVESVNGNGTVNISEMGWNWTQGNLNYRTVPASSFVYIY